MVISFYFMKRLTPLGSQALARLLERILEMRYELLIIFASLALCSWERFQALSFEPLIPCGGVGDLQKTQISEFQTMQISCI
jgi:hypothetical protein